MRNQLGQSGSVQIQDNETVQTSTGLIKVNTDGCDCGDFRSMGLPCRHLFAMLKHHNMSQDYPSVVNERWTRRYNIQLSQATPIDDILQCVSTPTRRKKTLTQNEKFRKPNIVLQDIASKLAQCGMDTFERHLSALKIAKEYIENDKDFSVVELRIVDTKSKSTALQAQYLPRKGTQCAN